MDALIADGVSVRYGSHTAVHPMTLRVARGQAVALIGANGAGKTSFIEGCLGLRPLASGQVHVDGIPMKRALRYGLVGVMLQQGGVPATARAGAWLAHVSRIFAAGSSPTPGSDSAVLDLLGINPRSKVAFKRLSGGEQQRVRLAAALLAPASLLILDEPSSGLDPALRRELFTLIGQRRDAGAAILLTTHRMDEIDGLFTAQDEIVVMAAGKVLEQGSVSTITGQGGAIRLTLNSEAVVLPAALATLSNRLGRLTSDAHQVSGDAPVGPIKVNGPTRSVRGLEITIQVPASPAILAEVMQWCSAQSLVPLEVRTDTRSLDQVIDPVTQESQMDGHAPT